VADSDLVVDSDLVAIDPLRSDPQPDLRQIVEIIE